MSQKPSDEDRKLFRAAVKGTRRLTVDTLKPTANKPKYKKEPITKIHSEEDFKPLTDHEIESVLADDQLSFFRSGIQTQYLRQLQKGKFPVEATLDLHGCTVEEARTNLLRFIRSAFKQRLRILRIIHGKGIRASESKPILKNKVNTWLKQFDEVLAFISAAPRDGGTGAVYVLLRSQKRTHDY